jgi:hypothetical protein
MRKARTGLRTLAIALLATKDRDILNKTRESVVQNTKIITTLVCDFYRVQNIWDKDFAQQIFEKPNRADLIVAGYIRGVVQFARQKPEKQVQVELTT